MDDAYILKGLLEGDPTILFTTIHDLEAAARRFRDQRQGEYLVCTGVPPHKFQQLGNDRSSVLYHARLLYIHNIKALRIKMPTSACHDVAADGFKELLHDIFRDMGVKNEITSSGTGIVHMENVDKQPDGSWGSEGKEYVTCVLEVGLSESQPKLAMNARLWLEKPDSAQGRIRQVVTMKLTPNAPRIILQRWEQQLRLERDTRSKNPPRAEMTEEVLVNLDANNVPTASGSFTLSFSKFFERPPAPGTQEREDITLDPQELADLARKVWKKQNLIPK